MAKIVYPDGSEEFEFTRIRDRLADLGIALREWSAPQTDRARKLMDKASLTDAEKEELLQCVEPRFRELQDEAGYSTRDMIVIHEDIPNLAEMLAKFDKIHFHSDDEVRYVLYGRGYFGFVEGNGDQFLLEVSEGDYINVPANTEHWFTMGDSQRIKAVRYFIDSSGWAPHYTDRALQFE